MWMTFSASRLSWLVSVSRGTVTRDCSLTLLSPFNFPIHFLHIVRRSEFCSGLIHHLMRATKSLLKSFPNNTFWRIFFLYLSIQGLMYSFAHLCSISFPPISLTVFLEGKRCRTIITLWFYLILTSSVFWFYSMQSVASDIRTHTVWHFPCRHTSVYVSIASYLCKTIGFTW